MELTQLYYFRTVARTEHFTKAADALHITQPTLSKTISRLEEDLGTKLFDRVGSHVRLNVYGQAFLQQVDDIFVLLEESRHQILELKDPETGAVSIAATLQELLSPFIRNYLYEHPGVHMYQRQATAEEMVKLLESRSVDFGISLRPIPSLNVEWIPLMREELGLIMSAKNPIADPAGIRLADAANERFLVHNSNDDLRIPFVNYCNQAGFQPNIFFEGDQPDLIGNLVENNYGISFGSKNRHFFQESKNMHCKDVVFVPITDIECYRTVGIGRLRGRTLSKASQLFFDYIIANLRPREPESIPY